MGALAPNTAFSTGGAIHLPTRSVRGSSTSARHRISTLARFRKEGAKEGSIQESKTGEKDISKSERETALCWICAHA